MTTPESFQSRPVPDVADLRLLTEIINQGAVGLPQAAWNAGMSQGEAAARLVTMAERGMPLRLVAEGDRQLLWQIAQAGPVPPNPPVAPMPTGAFLPPVTPLSPVTSQSPVTSLSPVPPTAMDWPTPAGPPAPITGPIKAVSGTSGVGSGSSEDFSPAADTGPVPIDRPATTVAPEAGSASVWGVPGSSDWVRPPQEDPADVDPGGAESDADVESQSSPNANSSDVGSDDAGPTDDGSPAVGSTHGPKGTESDDADDLAADSRAADDTGQTGGRPTAEVAAPSRRVLTSGQPVQAVEGLFGEQLDVGLQQILDPADNILTAVGYRIDAGERALLVQTSVGNRGPADYESPGDLYLEVVDANGTVLPKAAMSVNGYPAHQVGVPAHTLVSGWTVFLVPVDAEVAQVRWSVRPDLAHRTVTWGFGPAPADQY
jgi:hypothetical protein